MWLQVDWDKDPAIEPLMIKVKARKELKTDANGEISVPNVKGGPYLLEVLVLGTEGEGHFQSALKQESCLQVLEVRGKQVVAKDQH